MQLLTETCERVAATTKKLEKTAIVADYFRRLDPGDATIAAVFLSGRAFPAFEERTLQIGGSVVWKLVAELASRQTHAGETKEQQVPRLRARPSGRSARDDREEKGASHGTAKQAAEKLDFNSKTWFKSARKPLILR